MDNSLCTCYTSFPSIPMSTSAQNKKTMMDGPAVPAVPPDRGLAENMSNTLEQILDVLRGSTIAEELGKDVESKFWATYKKASNDHDGDFLERANDDMGIILTFAGLFSAVNSTFIARMQPNPGDTTNALMLQLIKVIADGPNAVNISTLSSSTTYSSSTAWTHALSYASLAFSVLAAFGAVMGKQWLNSYKAARGRGSLEERGMQRQKKFDGLERWRLQKILQAFFVLLQISLFLFGLSLSANMWTQQAVISGVIICTTAFGILCYVTTIFVSVLHPDSPFHTAGSSLVTAIFNKYVEPSTNDTLIKSSAIRWLLETTTNPDVIEAAAAIVPLAQWPADLDASAMYSRLRDAFTTYRDRQELFVKCGRAMAHLCIQPVKIDVELRHAWETRNAWGGKSRFIHDAFMAGRDAWDKLTKETEKYDRLKLMKPKADARTALRTMVVHGQSSCLSRPNDEKVIWDGDLQWRHNDGRKPVPEDYDWLVDYLADQVNHETDDETKGDSLLALSAMHGLGSSAKRSSYVKALIHCMHRDRPPRVQYAALRAIYDAREELSSFRRSSMPHGVDAKLLDDLSSGLLTTVRPNDGRMFDYDCDPHFTYGRAHCYLRLIFSLAKNDEWHQRLICDGHIQQCTFLSQKFLTERDLGLHIAWICLFIDPSGKDPSLSPMRERWGDLTIRAWSGLSFIIPADKHCLEMLPALVKATKEISDNSVRSVLRELSGDVDLVLRTLQGGGSIDGGGAVVSAVRSFSDYLHRKLERSNTL